MVSSEAATLATQVSSEAPTHVSGRAAWLSRGAFCLVALLVAYAFISGIPASFNRALAISSDTAGVLDSLGLPRAFPAAFLVGVDVLMMTGFALVALVLFWRRSDDWMALYVGALLLLTALIYTDPAYHNAAPLWLVAGLIALGETLQITFFYIFPDGRFVPRWGRWLVPPLFAWRITTWAQLYLPNLFAGPPTTAETYGRVPQDSIDIGLMMLLFALGIASQVYRYRRLSTPSQRQQVKWLLVGVALIVAVVGGWVFLVNVLDLLGGDAGAAFVAYLGARLMRQAALLAFPLALGIAILRHGLWNIDLIINRGLVYGALTTLYIVTVVLFLQIFGAVTGARQSSVAVALSTALIAVLFQPIRRRIQRFVDRRFYPAHAMMLSKPPVTVTRPGLYTGWQVGPYQIGDLLRRGGMGEVYRGRHEHLDRTVAVKILPAARTHNNEFRLRFEREARMVASLRHTNVVSVFDYGSTDDTAYIVMEYINGVELSSYLAEHGPLSLEDAVPLVRDIAAALDYAHASGLVHRDVKPSNVMLQPITAANRESGPYRAILMDFGIAKMLGGDTGLTQTGTMGTVDYIAPEQIIDAREVDNRADIYSLGVMVFQMLTGRLPFEGSNPGQVLIAHLHASPPDIRDFAPELPGRVASALMRAMTKAPEERFNTAGEFAEALAETPLPPQPYGSFLLSEVE